MAFLSEEPQSLPEEELCQGGNKPDRGCRVQKLNGMPHQNDGKHPGIRNSSFLVIEMWEKMGAVGWGEEQVEEENKKNLAHKRLKKEEQ